MIWDWLAIAVFVVLFISVLLLATSLRIAKEQLKEVEGERNHYKAQLDGETSRISQLQNTITRLELQLVETQTKPDQEFKELVQEQEGELGFGHHVKWRSHRKPTAQTYRIHFDIDPNGQRILEELTTRFKRNPFTDDERETCRRLGRAEVVDFIINRINTANDPRYNEQLELAHMEQNNG